MINYIFYIVMLIITCLFLYICNITPDLYMCEIQAEIIPGTCTSTNGWFSGRTGCFFKRKDGIVSFHSNINENNSVYALKENCYE